MTAGDEGVTLGEVVRGLDAVRREVASLRGEVVGQAEYKAGQAATGIRIGGLEASVAEFKGEMRAVLVEIKAEIDEVQERARANARLAWQTVAAPILVGLVVGLAVWLITRGG